MPPIMRRVGGRSVHELVVEGNVFFEGRLLKCCVGIDGGRITDVRKVLKGETLKDFGDRLVLPGAIDCHVHFRDPGQIAKEDFRTGTLAAAHAGVTTVLDMPNNMPPVNSPEALHEKARHIRGRAVVDYGLFMALDRKVGPAAVRSVARKAVAIKLFNGPTVGGIGRPDDALLMEDLAAAASVGLTVCAHCEDPKRFPKGAEENARSMADLDVARPAEAEVAAVDALLELGAKAGKGVRLHIAHVSSEMTLEMLGRWKEAHKDPEAMRVTSEVTPHHLFLDNEMALDARGKVYPPVRSRANNDLLWRTLMEGDLDIVATDHAPHTVEEKSMPFAEAPAGMPGVETCLPMFLHLLKRQRVDLQRLIQMFSGSPSSIYRLDARKGAISKGKDADLIVVDMKKVVPIKAKSMSSKCGWTPYEGNEAIFPWVVMVRGEMVVQDGEVLSPARTGRDIVKAMRNDGKEKDNEPE